jgi:hypothetical protein
MLDPHEKTSTAFKKIHQLHNEKYYYGFDVYPEEVMEKAYKRMTVPKTIFKPSRKVIRTMIKELVCKDHK